MAALRPLVVALGVLPVALMLAPLAQRGPVPAPARSPSSATDAAAPADEVVRARAAGHDSSACDRPSRLAAVASAAEAERLEVGRCLERWGWQALRAGHAEEALGLFRRGLAAAPGVPALLRGLGVAAVHAGRPDDAVAPLERAARQEFDGEVHLLLARLYDRRDEPERAVDHLRAILAREPARLEAWRLLARLEHARRVEEGYHREVTARFVLKYRSTRPDVRHSVQRALEVAAARLDVALGWQPRERLVVVLHEPHRFPDATGVHAWAGGLFDGKIRLAVGQLSPAAADLVRIVTHEYAHAAIHDLARGRAPRWLHEGLAQVLDGTVVDPMLRVPGRPTLVGIEALLTHADPLHARTGYDLALWVTTDLLERGGLPGARDLLRRLGAGQTLAEAVPDVYGLHLADLEGQWRRLLGG